MQLSEWFFKSVFQPQSNRFSMMLMLTVTDLKSLLGERDYTRRLLLSYEEVF